MAGRGQDSFRIGPHSCEPNGLQEHFAGLCFIKRNQSFAEPSKVGAHGSPRRIEGIGLDDQHLVEILRPCAMNHHLDEHSKFPCCSAN